MKFNQFYDKGQCDGCGEVKTIELNRGLCFDCKDKED